MQYNGLKGYLAHCMRRSTTVIYHTALCGLTPNSCGVQPDKCQHPDAGKAMAVVSTVSFHTWM